jgi:tetratricopeptide (TPR) repeat protein
MQTKTVARAESPARDAVLYLGLGLLIGLALIAARQAWAVYRNVADIHTYFDQRLATSETQGLLGKATMAGLAGDNEGVKSILLPNIEKFTNVAEVAEANSLLGKAEYNLGHPQLAAGYFEKVYLYEPNSANLFTLSQTYDTGGNLDQALTHYTLFLSSLDPTATGEMIIFAQQRVREIMGLKGLATPESP